MTSLIYTENNRRRNNNWFCFTVKTDKLGINLYKCCCIRNKEIVVFSTNINNYMYVCIEKVYVLISNYSLFEFNFECLTDILSI